MWGSETLATVLSSTSMKVASITETAMSHGLARGCHSAAAASTGRVPAGPPDPPGSPLTGMRLQCMNVSTKSELVTSGRPRPVRGARTGRKARERARRSAEVLAAARRLYARKGYQQTAMVEIARASELAVGTLYQLFPSKEAILRGLLEETMDVLIGRVRAAVGEETDVRDRLRHVVETHLRFARENADILRLYLSGWIGYDVRTRQRFGDRIDARYERYLAVLTAVFREGVEAGALVPRPPRQLAVTLAGLIHAIIRRGLRERGLDLLAEGEALLDLFLHGVLPRGPAAGRRRGP